MPDCSSYSIHPDPVDILPAGFRIEGLFGVRAVLRELMARKAPVSLYFDDRSNDFLITRLAYLDETELEFELALSEADEARGEGEADETGGAGEAEVSSALRPPADAQAAQRIRTLAAADSLCCVAFPGRVKTQFRLDQCSLASDPASGRPVLRAPIPSELWRIQRRDAFRVAPPPEDEARCVRRLPPDGEAGYALADISAGGAAVLLPAEVPAPPLGERWPHSRIETAGGRVIPCDLIVRHVDEQPLCGGAHRIGLAFQYLPSEVQRQIQLYVIDLDKRLRGG